MSQKTVRFITSFSGQSSPLIVLESLLSLLLIGVIDQLSGPELSFSIFYLGPIVLATWASGKRTGILLALIGSLIWFSVEILSNSRYSHELIPVWNALVRLGFFLIITQLITVLQERLKNERSFASTDYVTGLSNFRSFSEHMTAELERLRRYNHPFTVIFLDLDNFKYVNDTYGHQRGDEILAIVGQQLRSQLRTTDFPARIGGDEFVILCPESDYYAAKSILEKLQTSIRTAMQNEAVPVTASIGAMTFFRPMDSVTDMLHEADELMYEVKRQGKNAYLLRQYPPPER